MKYMLLSTNKKSLKAGLLGLLSLLSVACADFLDVRPETQIILEDYWQKGSDVEAVLLTCYRSMQEDDFMHRVIVWGELRSDNMIASPSAKDPEKEVNKVNILPSNANCSWASFYKVINYCNTILEYAPGVLEKDLTFTQNDLDVKIAETLAIRALCYFYLVRTFRDVPWMEEAIVGDDQNVQIPQATPSFILDRITADLLQAEQGAMISYPKTADTKGRMTQDAIRALLADVYLWKKDYANCVLYCNKLIDAKSEYSMGLGSEPLPKYTLEEDMPARSIFIEGNSSESIFELQFSSQRTNRVVINLYGKETTVGQLSASTFYIGNELLYKGKEDIRRGDNVVGGNSTSSSAVGVYKIGKYINYSSLSTGNFYRSDEYPNWIFYRLADIMLMKAEALTQLNRSEEDLKEALSMVNATYMRSNPTLQESDSLAFDAYSDPKKMEELVLQERQKELMFEGKRWFDLLRIAERNNSPEALVNHVLNKYDADLSTIKAKLGVMNALYLPIHEGELKTNKALKQNPNYETSSNINK